MDRSRETHRSADQTRDLLVDAATRVFAEQGVPGASLLEITLRAGQRNRGAVHYHFGSRDGILVAVLERPVDVLARREAELLDVARGRPGDLGAALEAIVRPAVELSETDWRGGCYLQIVRGILEQDPDTVDPAVWAAIHRTGGAAVYELITERMPDLPAPLRDERLFLMSIFVLQAAADRASTAERPTLRRPRLPETEFTSNLLAMAVAMLAAPTAPTP